MTPLRISLAALALGILCFGARFADRLPAALPQAAGWSEPAWTPAPAAAMILLSPSLVARSADTEDEI